MTWLALAALLCAPAGEPMTATLVEGTVTVAGTPLVAGAVLQPGDTVETQSGGRAEIALPGGSLLRIGENTRVTLSPVPARGEFSARLFFGNLWARVHKLLGSETFRVETENGVAGVRGTEFRVEVAREQPDLVRVYEGTVEVQGREGRWSHALEAGTELRFRREAETPREFDARSESGHKFMEWVRSRATKDGIEPGRIRPAETRNPEQEHRIRERVRRRRDR
jgi:ferric-dicitrate binding protein FerR (iron transport regulator)